MKLVNPQHLKWVLLCGLLLLFKLDASLADVEGISEVTAPNVTSDKEAVASKRENSELPLENLSDGINAVPLSPDEDEDIKSSDLAPPEGIRRLEEDGLVSFKDSDVTEPEKSEEAAKNVDTPSVNAVASDVELLQEDQAAKKQTNATTETPDEKIGTTKSSQDDTLQFEYPPKGRTLSYKDNATNSDNSDVLKNTVPFEPKAVKIEENQDKEGDRWIKKQKGISSSSQSSRLNKERNLSGSYLPALAALNTVNRTSLSEPSSDKFIKYQRRKRPWSAQQNSSNLSIPEETTVWSLASLKSTPKERPYADVKPIVHWSTIVNKPTTEFQPKLTSPTPVPLSSDFFSEVSATDSDWIGISKLDISDVPSIKVTSTSTDVPLKLIDANFTSPSSSINLIDTSVDKDVVNETSKILETPNPPVAQNASKTTSQTLSPEFSNVINESESSVKLHPSTTTHSAPTTEENVKHLSIFPSPFSNSVNELHEEEDIVDVPSGSDEPKYGKNKTTEKLLTSTVSYATSSTETKQMGGIPSASSFNNSNHPNISQMFSGKNSYADGFNFSTTPSYDGKKDLTTKPENNSVEFGLHYNTTPLPSEVNTLNSTSSKPTLIPAFESTNKIAHVTSTMLPNKMDESSEKTVTQVTEVSSITIPHSTESEFNIKLTDMFNMSHTPDSTFVPIHSSDKSFEPINNSTTSQPKEFNEILLDVDKSQTTTEKNPKPISTTTAEAPIISSLPSQEDTTNFETQLPEIKHKTNQSINFIELSDATEQTTLPKTIESNKEMELTSIKNEVKFIDLFNTTDSIILSTVSKYPGLVSASDKVPLPTTEETSSDSDEDISTFNDTLPFHPKPTKELEHSTEYEDKTPAILSDEGNTTKPTSDITPKYTSTSDNEPSRTPINPEPTHTLNIAITGEDEHEKFPMSEEDTIYDTADPIFTRLLIQANDKELCSSKEQLRDSIIRLFKTNGSEINRKQVVINNLGPKDCLFRNPPSEDGLFPIQVYLTNSQGHNDLFLTDKFIDLWQREGLDFTYPVKRVDKVIGTRKWVGMEEKSDGKSSMIAAIVISTIAGVCLLFIVILLVIIRKRQKGFTYGQRCTPVSLEDYSLDNISVYNSTRRKAARASKRSYGNPAFDDPGAISHVVNFATLANFCNNRSHIDEEFSQIPTVSVKPDELPPGVETKNRFANVIPIPETRVILNTNKGTNPDIDTYINANYVKGAKGEEKFYIACQAPMPDTISDFWQMIWEQQSRLVIMLTDLQEGGVEKCADYLPPSEVLDCHRVFGDLQVTLKKREVREKYVISNLQLKNLENNLWREVVHLWLTCWPPQGIPSEPTAVIAFLIEARSYIKSKENSSPIVVHCSPGTGRTGTIIAIDICIRDFEIRRTIDVPRTVCNIRKDRAGAVQTKDQYAFIYQVLHLYATKLTGGGLDSI